MSPACSTLRESALLLECTFSGVAFLFFKALKQSAALGRAAALQERLRWLQMLGKEAPTARADVPTKLLPQEGEIWNILSSSAQLTRRNAAAPARAAIPQAKLSHKKSF